MIPKDPQHEQSEAAKEYDRDMRRFEAVGKMANENLAKAGLTPDDVVKARREAEEKRRKSGSVNWDASMSGITGSGSRYH